jgi:hypothetical protein
VLLRHGEESTTGAGEDEDHGAPDMVRAIIVGLVVWLVLWGANKLVSNGR